MTKNNFQLVKDYQAMSQEQFEEITKSKTIVLPEGQEPIAEYLNAVRDCCQSSPKSQPLKLRVNPCFTAI